MCMYLWHLFLFRVCVVGSVSDLGQIVRKYRSMLLETGAYIVTNTGFKIYCVGNINQTLEEYLTHKIMRFLVIN